MCLNDHRSARGLFPRGLYQPSGSFRFAMDSLLLACFPDAQDVEHFADFGTGCGVVALGLLCRFPFLRGIGLESQAELAAAADCNAKRLGFGERFLGVHSDLRDIPFINALSTKPSVSLENNHRIALRPESFELILANPPFRNPRRGRVPQSALRRAALFEEPDTLTAFCRAAGVLLKPGGRFALLYPYEEENRLCGELERHGMKPVRMLPVQSNPDAPPKLLLLEARKTAPNHVLESFKRCPALVIRKGEGRTSRLSPEAIDFCPFLQR